MTGLLVWQGLFKEASYFGASNYLLNSLKLYLDKNNFSIEIK